MTPPKDMSRATRAEDEPALKLQVRDVRTAKRMAAGLATREERAAIRAGKHDRLGLKRGRARL